MVVSTGCWASTSAALFSERFHDVMAVSSSGAASPVVARTRFSSLPSCSAFRSFASVSLDSRSCVKACALPSSATGTALPRRCECISMSPAISICAAALLAMRLSRYTEPSSATSDTTTPTVSSRCCDENGMRPSHADTCSSGVAPSPAGAAGPASGSASGPPA
ncbi:hypothetical protein FQZ97_746190 [compost metagenome]